MGRRKKESPSGHRAQIAQAASALFLEHGAASVSMDDIAKAAGYSKATLYVYFENKDEIVRVLTLESMKKLAACVRAALQGPESTREKYDFICRRLIKQPWKRSTSIFKTETPFQRNEKRIKWASRSTA